MAMLRVSDDCEIHARWLAEKARMACMTNGEKDAVLRNLSVVQQRPFREYNLATFLGRATYFGMRSVQIVSLDVLLLCSSLVIVERW